VPIFRSLSSGRTFGFVRTRTTLIWSHHDHNATWVRSKSDQVGRTTIWSSYTQM